MVRDQDGTCFERLSQAFIGWWKDLREETEFTPNTNFRELDYLRNACFRPPHLFSTFCDYAWNIANRDAPFKWQPDTRLIWLPF